MDLPKVLAFVDVETTGTSFNRDKIIDIGIIRVENEKIVETFESLIDPQSYLPQEITNLTGISCLELASAPTFYSLKDKILSLLDQAVFVAHNANFDYRFVKSEFKRCSTSFNSKRLCTVKLSRLLYPRYKKHNLDSLIQRHKLKNTKRHRGFGDAHIVYQFYHKALKSNSERFANTVSKLLYSNSNLIPGKEGLIKNLKCFPGVYVFYDKKNTPLYVGKSVNVKKRVQSHFSITSSPTDLKLSARTTFVETIRTAGELEALVLESSLIKKLSPLYNRLLKNKSEFVVAELTDNIGSFFEIKLRNTNKISEESLKNIVGVFKSIKQAKNYLAQKAQEYSLCDKLLGLQKTKNRCFGFSLGRCKGACFGLENHLKYNLRVMGAFFKDKFKPWPFESPIIIEEGSSEEKTFHLVDKWCYLGKVKENLDSILNDKHYDFDLDIYKILYRFINSPKNKNKIKTLNTEFDSKFYSAGV